MPKKPRLFDELAQAFEELTQWKEGKIALKTYTVEPTHFDKKLSISGRK